jgi:hypothetical protein
MAFLTADRRGLLTKARRTLSTFSGVLREGCLPGGFLFTAEAVSLKFLTHNSTVLRLGTTFVPMNVQVATKYPLSHNDRIVVLKYGSTAKARCPNDQRSMATEIL